MRPRDVSSIPSGWPSAETFDIDANLEVGDPAIILDARLHLPRWGRDVRQTARWCLFDFVSLLGGLLAQGHEGLLSTRLELRSVSTFLDWLNLFWCALFCWGFNSRPVLQSSDMCSRFLPWLQALPGCFAGVRKWIFQRAEAICLH